MTLRQLEAEIVRRESEGRTRMILSVTRKSAPRGRRVRVLPGVLGELLSYCGGSTVVDVKVEDLRRYLDRALDATSTP